MAGLFIRHKGCERTVYCAISTDPKQAWVDFLAWSEHGDQDPTDFHWCYIMDGSDGLKDFPEMREQASLDFAA